MTGASGINTELTYVRETVHGTTPGAPVMKTLRVQGRNINRRKNMLRPPERRRDRQRTDVRHGFRQVVGSLPFNLGIGDFDDVIEILLGTTFATVTTGSTSLEALANGYQRAAGSFITDGFGVGDEVTASGFTTGGNNGRSKVTAVTATVLTVNKVGMAPEASQAGRTVSCVGRIAKVGTQLHTATIERRFLDIAKYQLFTGCNFNGLTLNATPEQVIGGTLDVIGMTGTGYIDTTLGDPQLPTANSPFDSFTGVLLENGVEVGIVSGLSLTITNNRSVTPTIFRKDAIDIFDGMAQIAGQMTIQFHDADILDKFDDESDSSIDVRFDDLGGVDFHRLRLSRIKYTADDIDPPASGPCIATLPFDCLVDGVSGTSMLWQVSNDTTP